jgi:predicted kinase
MGRAVDFLGRTGYVAILDATNVSQRRREKIITSITDHPILFIECINGDEKILKASIQRKVALPEFSHLNKRRGHQELFSNGSNITRAYTPPWQRNATTSSWIP